MSIEDVSLRGMALAVSYDADGTSNLPLTGGGTGAESAAAPAVRVGRFDLRDFTLDWRDEARDFALQLPPTSVRLIAGEETGSAASGPITMGGTARIAWRGTASEISRLDGALGFDGAALDIRRLDVTASEGDLTISGRVDNLLDRPRLDLQYKAQIDLARAASWRAGTSASGDLAVAGDANLTTGGLTASASLSATAARWNGMVVDQLDAAVTLTPTAVRLDDLRLDTAGGILTAAGRVARTAEWPGRLEAAWIGLDLDRCASLSPAEAEGSLRPVGRTRPPFRHPVGREPPHRRPGGQRRTSARRRRRPVARDGGSAVRRSRPRVGNHRGSDRPRGLTSARAAGEIHHSPAPSSWLARIWNSAVFSCRRCATGTRGPRAGERHGQGRGGRPRSAARCWQRSWRRRR